MPLDLFSAFLFACWGVILYRLHATGIMRRYWPVVAYTLASAGTLAARTLATWRWSAASYEYGYAFAATEVVFVASACLMLAWIYFQPSSLDRRRDWAIPAIAAVALLLEMWAPDAHPVLRLTRVLAVIRAGFGFLTVLKVVGHYPKWRIGRNLGTVLVCEFFQAGFLALSEILYVSGLLPFGALAGFGNLAHVVAWGAIAVGLWDLDTPETRD